MSSPAIPTISAKATYRTKLHNTERILRDWILKERLAFDLQPSKSLAELQSVLPVQCKQQLGDFKPTENVFRKMSSGFNNVSDCWIELMRFIGVWDFSPEQAILGTVSTFLDKENVRVELIQVSENASRANAIKVFCLNEPSYQGIIRYDRDSLVIPGSIFDVVVQRRLDVYRLHCDYLGDILSIPNTEEKLTASDELEDSLELEAERNSEAATDARLEQMAEDRDAERMAEIYSGSDDIDESLDF